MGMDVYGNDGSYFRANVWSWRAIMHAIELADYPVPGEWHTNDGAGLNDQSGCDELADRLDAFLQTWTDDELVWEQTSVRVNQSGAFVDANTPGSKSPYSVEREHLVEFVEFLRACQGFAIC